MFDPRWRDRALAALDRPFDLVVLGGGITGCGILLDAAQRGLRALLVEQGDIACGTSSRSSKLIHGGLRYLRQLQLGVTRASCRERDLQLRLSPHLVTPIDFLYPAYRGGRPPAWQVELGLRLYDRLTAGPRRHRRIDAEAVAELSPHLVRDGLDRGLLYGDARADDARLTLAVAATAYAHGGQVLTRAGAEAAMRDAGGRVGGVVVRDHEAGGTAHRVAAALVVNATGVWVDATRARLGLEGIRLRPSRGSHLLFSSERLPLASALTVPSPDDGRPVFFIPHPEGVLLGTTDLFHHGPLDDPRPSPREVAYLLAAARAAFPGRGLGEDHVLGAFAGLRPVLANAAGEPSKASREEAVWEEEGVLSVAGGKLTTWRLMAEHAVDTALRHLPSEVRRRAAPCATAGTPLAGLAPDDLAARLTAAARVEPAVAAALARRLGATAWTALALARDAGEMRPLADGHDLCAAEVRAHLRHGAVLHLDDLLLRRVRLGMWRPARADALVPRLRPVVASALGWDAARWDRERARYAAAALGWRLEGVRTDRAEAS